MDADINETNETINGKRYFYHYVLGKNRFAFKLFYDITIFPCFMRQSHSLA